jgi:hypothetical protein
MNWTPIEPETVQMLNKMRFKELINKANKLPLDGCGSLSCLIRKPKGQGTNGPCTCSERKLRTRLSRLYQAIERFKDELDTKNNINC